MACIVLKNLRSLSLTITSLEMIWKFLKWPIYTHWHWTKTIYPFICYNTWYVWLWIFVTQGKYPRSDGASYCKPKKVHEPETLHPKNTWHQNFLPNNIQDYNTSMLIYYIKQALRPKKHVTDLLTQKYTEGVNFQPSKCWTTSPVMYTASTPPPPHLGFGPSSMALIDVSQKVI